MIELVVFDMAGTTVHDGDAVNSAFRATLAEWQLDADPAQVDAVMGLYKPDALRILLDGFGGERIRPTPETIDAMHASFNRRMLAFYETDASIREIPGAAETFASIRAKGIKVALNTGFSRPIADAILRRLGWSIPDVVDAVVTSDEVAHGRPHPDMIRHLMATFGISDPLRVAKVGDTRADLEEGTGAGCALVIGVTTGSFTREELGEYPHTHIVESVADVPGLIEG